MYSSKPVDLREERKKERKNGRKKEREKAQID